VRLTLNGEIVEIPDESSITEVLAQYGRDDAGVAVAVNLSVVPRADYAEIQLREGDRVDVVTAVGGG